MGLDNGMLQPMPGEQPAAAPDVPGVVHVTVKIPCRGRSVCEEVIPAVEVDVCARFLRCMPDWMRSRLRGEGFYLDDIDTESTFEPDQDSEPGEDGGR